MGRVRFPEASDRKSRCAGYALQQQSLAVVTRDEAIFCNGCSERSREIPAGSHPRPYAPGGATSASHDPISRGKRRAAPSSCLAPLSDFFGYLSFVRGEQLLALG